MEQVTFRSREVPAGPPSSLDDHVDQVGVVLRRHLHPLNTPGAVLLLCPEGAVRLGEVMLGLRKALDGLRKAFSMEILFWYLLEASQALPERFPSTSEHPPDVTGV